MKARLSVSCLYSCRLSGWFSLGQVIWLVVLYSAAGLYSGRNPLDVLRFYGPAWLTAVGTMSSAATLPVALACARRSPVLRRDMVDFGVPLFANIHLCGSVLTEVFFCLTISLMLYGSMPSPGTIILFCLLLGIFAIGAPGVPGGTVMASLGLIGGVLGFDADGLALMLTIFALQDSFGTACNVTGDGALTLMLTGYAERGGLRRPWRCDGVPFCGQFVPGTGRSPYLRILRTMVESSTPRTFAILRLLG